MDPWSTLYVREGIKDYRTLKKINLVLKIH